MNCKNLHALVRKTKLIVAVRSVGLNVILVKHFFLSLDFAPSRTSLQSYNSCPGKTFIHLSVPVPRLSFAFLSSAATAQLVAISGPSAAATFHRLSD